MARNATAEEIQKALEIASRVIEELRLRRDKTDKITTIFKAEDGRYATLAGIFLRSTLDPDPDPVQRTQNAGKDIKIHPITQLSDSTYSISLDIRKLQARNWQDAANKMAERLEEARRSTKTNDERAPSTRKPILGNAYSHLMQDTGKETVDIPAGDENEARAIAAAMLFSLNIGAAADRMVPITLAELMQRHHFQYNPETKRMSFHLKAEADEKWPEVKINIPHAIEQHKVFTQHILGTNRASNEYLCFVEGAIDVKITDDPVDTLKSNLRGELLKIIATHHGIQKFDCVVATCQQGLAALRKMDITELQQTPGEPLNDAIKKNFSRKAAVILLENLQDDTIRERARAEEENRKKLTNLGSDIRKAQYDLQEAGRPKPADIASLNQAFKKPPPQGKHNEKEWLHDGVKTLAEALDVRDESTVEKLATSPRRIVDLTHDQQVLRAQELATPKERTQAIKTAGQEHAQKKAEITREAEGIAKIGMTTAMHRELARMILSQENVRRAANALGMITMLGAQTPKRERQYAKTISQNKQYLSSHPEALDFLVAHAVSNPMIVPLLQAAVDERLLTTDPTPCQSYMNTVKKTMLDWDDHQRHVTGRKIAAPAMQALIGAQFPEYQKPQEPPAYPPQERNASPTFSEAIQPRALGSSPQPLGHFHR